MGQCNMDSFPFSVITIERCSRAVFYFAILDSYVCMAVPRRAIDGHRIIYLINSWKWSLLSRQTHHNVVVVTHCLGAPTAVGHTASTEEATIGGGRPSAVTGSVTRSMWPGSSFGRDPSCCDPSKSNACCQGSPRVTYPMSLQWHC